MAINERLVHTASAAGAGAGTGNQEEGLILHLDANDVDSYDGDGSVWYDITNHEFTPAVDPAENFNTVTYTGNETSQSITGVGFQPDLIWVKNRDTTNNHLLFDSIRGNNFLIPNDTFAEDTSSSNTMSSFDSDGFSISGGGGSLNNSSDNYVAWCFKAGGAAVSNTDGATTSQVSANQDLGFSIVKHTGTGSNTTIGHGLGVPPELVISKNLVDASNWSVSGSVGGLIYGTNKLALHNTDAIVNDSNEIISASATTISPGSSGATNGSGDGIIHYCFASKRGVSKVGSFIGTGSAGNKIYTGFEPAFIFTKRSSSSGGGWYLLDNKRDTATDKKKFLRAGNNIYEQSSSTGVTFNGDGFTFNGASFNTSGQTHIYLAFAAEKATSLIDDTDLELHLDPASYSGSGSTWSDLANSNDGTISGASYDEELGDWFDFDGSNDNVTISPTSFNSASALTVEAWLNKDNNNAFYTFTTLRGTASNSVKFLLALNINGTLRLDSASGTNFLTLYSGNTSYQTTVGKWHHVAASIDYNSKDWAIYLDGEKIANGTNSSIRGATQFNPDLFAIGMNYNQQYFNGQIGQYRVYDSVLSETDIRQNFNFTKNDYPNGYNFTNSGNTSWNPSGYFDFNGVNDRFNAISFKGRPIQSWALWINPDTVNTRYTILTTYPTGTIGKGAMYIELRDDAKIEAGLRNESGSTSSVNSTTTLSANQWQHIVVTSDGTDLTIYINSVERGSTSASVTTFQDSLIAPIGIGYEIRNVRNYFNGQMSDIKVFHKGLTQSEVTAQYNIGYSGIG